MNKLLKIIIVDDEAPARANIRLMLGGQLDVNIVAECTNGKEAIAQIKSLKPDVVFLDIQMPEIDGFEVLRQLTKTPSFQNNLPQIIFATAYDQYALQAFEVNAIDYLLKPFNDHRFYEALDRVRSQLNQDSSDEIQQALNKLLKTMNQASDKYLERLSVRHSGMIHLVPVSDLLWIEAENQYVNLHTKSRSHLLRTSLRELESRLNPQEFYRAHRSTIVRLDAIASMEPYFKGDYWLHLKNNQKIKLSRNRVEGLKERLYTS